MPYNLNDVKILVVEDMAPMMTLMRSVLQIFGFKKLCSALNLEEAYEVYKKENPDIIITDWLTGEENGLKLINKIRKDEDSPNPYIPIILMTGYSNRDRVEAARDNGMTEFLVKPYTARDLYNRIARLIENPRKFVKTSEFFGPDRRRHKDEGYTGEIKRKKDYYAEQSQKLKDAADIIMKDRDNLD